MSGCLRLPARWAAADASAILRSVVRSALADFHPYCRN